MWPGICTLSNKICLFVGRPLNILFKTTGKLGETQLSVPHNTSPNVFGLLLLLDREVTSLKKKKGGGGGGKRLTLGVYGLLSAFIFCFFFLFCFRVRLWDGQKVLRQQTVKGKMLLICWGKLSGEEMWAILCSFWCVNACSLFLQYPTNDCDLCFRSLTWTL